MQLYQTIASAHDSGSVYFSIFPGKAFKHLGQLAPHNLMHIEVLCQEKFKTTSEIRMPPWGDVSELHSRL